MKKILFVSFSLLMCSILLAQPNKNIVAPPKNNAHLKAFYQALVSGDVNTGIVALNYYISEQGSNTPYADTLAMLYMQQGSFAQSYFWADQRLKAKPEDDNLLEIKGYSLDKLQQPKEAITIFEKLYAKTHNPFHAYKLMELQYGIKRLAECVATANSVEKLQFKPEYVMSYNVGEQTGRTYLQAGVYNIHALALYELDQKAEAKSYFAKAVALDSNFVLARQNLDAVIAAEKGPAKVNPNNPNQQPGSGNKQN
jgi:tetratricopeptide (TPR) repeat protein